METWIQQFLPGLQNLLNVDNVPVPRPLQRVASRTVAGRSDPWHSATNKHVKHKLNAKHVKSDLQAACRELLPLSNDVAKVF